MKAVPEFREFNVTKALSFDLPRSVRRIRPSVNSLTGRVASAKNGVIQDSESSLEQDFLTILEFDPFVLSYAVQPTTIGWLDENGRLRRYTPDVLAKHHPIPSLNSPAPKSVLYEVKPRAVLRRDWHELRPRYKAAMKWAKKRDLLFHIVTDTEIRTPYLGNARFLLRYSDSVLAKYGELDAEREHVIRSTLFTTGQATPRSLLTEITKDLSEQGRLLPWLWNAIGRGLVGCDLHQKLAMESPIWTLVPPETE
ncbi:MAG: TnsA endonuclease N-terminal domain-containing protein [Gammaproteobacteria bacterium]|nr:TnsA endonuclease N-terminal domain-containing protein [Gammaproteobacteria bacterium]MCP5136364.1 TnsA endonuclease N-terminal domain-containing protein [Gammaproteobacteria bacterium]